MKTARNDITGDPLKTGATNQVYRDNWDKIFGTDTSKGDTCLDDLGAKKDAK